MTEFNEKILSEIGCDFLSGFAFKSSDYSNRGIPLIKIGNIQNREVKINFDGDFVSESLINDKTKKFLLINNDVLIAMTGQGSVGRVGKMKLLNEEAAFLNQRVGKFICDEVNIHKEYLYYILSSDAYQDYLFNTGAGSGQPNLSPELILKTKIPWVEFSEQKAIASVLSSLDDKIDLLHRQNTTLEKMAETLFRQWFVEEAKEEWEEVELGDLIEINGGFSYKGEYIGTGEALLLGMGCVSFQDKFLIGGARPYSGDCPEKYLVNPTDLVIATRQQSDNLPILGFPAIIPPEFKGKKVIVGANLYRVKNNTQIDNYLFYLILRSAEYRKHILASSKGSTVRMITKDAIEKYKIALPPTEVIEYLMQLLKPINEKSITNQTQIRTLTAMRDNLLPKLMSGEVRVNETI